MRFAAAVCLTVATALVGFAHRPLPGFRTGPDLVEAGGIAFGSFCVARVTERDDDGTAKTTVVVRPCDACLLFSAPGLGAVAEIAPPPPVARVLERLAARDQTVHPRQERRATARGPPGFVAAT